MDIADIVMSSAKNNTLIKTLHYLEQVELRQNEIVPDDVGIQNLMSTKTPIHIEKQTGDRFKLLYNIDLKYDLVIVVSYKNFSKDNISLITVYQQESKRRPGN